MKSVLKLGFVVGLIGLTGCSNNGKTVDSPQFSEDTNWAQVIGTDLSQYNEGELKQIFWGYAQQEYAGETTAATLSPESLQRFLTTGDPGVPVIDYAVMMDDSVNIQSCPTSGLMRFSGQLNDDGGGLFSVEYEACRQGEQEVSGSGFVGIDKLEPRSPYGVNAVIFYKDVDFTSSEGRWRLNGYQKSAYELGEAVFGHIEASHLVYDDLVAGEQSLFRRDWSHTISIAGEHFSDAGGVFLAGDGEFSLESDDNSVTQHLTGLNGQSALLEYSPWFKVLLDSEEGDELSLGGYYSDVHHFLSKDFSTMALEAVDDLVEPPYLDSVILVAAGEDSSEFTIESEIGVELSVLSIGSFEENLEFAYVWLVNDVAIQNQEGDTFSPENLELGDSIKVAVTLSVGEYVQSFVSDGIEIIEVN